MARSELAAQRAALVLISHDRRFLREPVAGHGVARSRPDRGASSAALRSFEAWRDEQLAEEEAAQHKLDRKIVREEHWVRYGVTARRKRNVRRMAELQALRADAPRLSRAPPARRRSAASEADKSGTLVVEAKGIGKAFGERPIVADFSIRILRGDRIGIVGPNGSGKTTLVSLLTGALAPDSGTVRLGANLEMATLDQGRESLDPNWTLAEALTGGRGDIVDGRRPAQARRRLHEGLPVRARAGAHAARACCRAASAAA